MTVFAAAAGLAACAEYCWLPRERNLSLKLDSLNNGGSVIFPEATGFIPRPKGRLNPIRDPRDRTYLYTSSVAVNDGQSLPLSFDYGQKLRLTDAHDNEVVARVFDIVGRSALLEFRVILIRPESQPESRPESLESRVLRLLAAGPMSKTSLSTNLGQKKISGQLNKVVRLLVDEGKIALHFGTFFFVTFRLGSPRIISDREFQYWGIPERRRNESWLELF